MAFTTHSKYIGNYYLYTYTYIDIHMESIRYELLLYDILWGNRFACLLVVLHQSNKISVILWQLFEVGDEKEKARAYTFPDSRDF